ncbi:MAG: protein kinase [Candidatus Eiseniibacteriota bacterium]|nr:MAG: protein kinase [Candidatus Eisenbacteria bacterium]
MIGKTISHYKILEKLGEGGMGVVYKAEDTTLGRTVALKFLPPELTRDLDAKTRFIREAKAAAALNHPNICTIHEIDEAEGSTFIAMEYVKGTNLKEKVGCGPLKLEEFVHISEQLAAALEKAHEKGVVHRDIKSANIMVVPDGQVKILDFGLAKFPGATKVTRMDATAGTIAYMSPEQTRGDSVDNRTDIWSLGVVLHEMLTGRLPFSGGYDQAIVYSILNEEPKPISAFRSRVPAEMEMIVRRSMSKSPGERFQSASELLVNLRALGKLLEAGGSQISTSVPKRRGKSIAVLPFRNMVPDPENEWFADGITEDVITQLSKIGDLRVISRTSVMLYKDSRKSLREIGRELGVGTILEGSVRRAGDRVRIVAQLLDAESDEHIWAETYDSEMRDIFDIQSDVARQIAAALKAQLSPQERELLEKKPTDSPTAYDLYLRGREYYMRYHRRENEVAIELFKKALKIDPNYALAYAGLADAYILKRIHHGDSASWLDSGLEAGQKALSIDPDCAEAHKAVGLAYMGRGWLQKALEENIKAVELNPSYRPAVANIGWVHFYKGRMDEALPWMKRDMSLGPMQAYVHFSLGVTYICLGDVSEGEKSFSRALELQPDLTYAHCGMVEVHLIRGEHEQAVLRARKLPSLAPDEVIALHWAGRAGLFVGDYEKAKEHFERAMDVSPEYVPPFFSVSHKVQLAYILWKTGREDEAKPLLEEGIHDELKRLEEGDESTYPSYNIAAARAVEGNKEETCIWLRKAMDAGWLSHHITSVEPSFENLRDDERFKQITNEMKQKLDEMRRRVAKAEGRADSE